MNILALDTCFDAVSVAVRWRSGRGEWMVREAYEARNETSAERLMPMIVEVMDGAGLDFSSLDRVAVTVGPGTFTGVRVGIAAARGLALATGKAAVGVTSLAAMARRAVRLLDRGHESRPLLVAVDARRGAIYGQMFAAGGSEVGPPLLLTADEAAQMIGPDAAIAVGSGAKAVAEAVAAHGGSVEALLPDLQPHARAVAELAVDLTPASPLKPLYLRPPDVKPQAHRVLPRVAP